MKESEKMSFFTHIQNTSEHMQMLHPKQNQNLIRLIFVVLINIQMNAHRISRRTISSYVECIDSHILPYNNLVPLRPVYICRGFDASTVR